MYSLTLDELKQKVTKFESLDLNQTYSFSILLSLTGTYEEVTPHKTGNVKIHLDCYIYNGYIYRPLVTDNEKFYRSTFESFYKVLLGIYRQKVRQLHLDYFLRFNKYGNIVENKTRYTYTLYMSSINPIDNLPNFLHDNSANKPTNNVPDLNPNIFKNNPDIK